MATTYKYNPNIETGTYFGSGLTGWQQPTYGDIQVANQVSNYQDAPYTDSTKKTAGDTGQMNYSNMLAGFEAAVGLGNLALGYENLGLQKDAFNFNKDMSKNKFNAEATQYNAGIDRYNAINNRITDRRHGLGELDASYTNKESIKKM